MSAVKHMLGRMLRRAQGSCYTRWWAYVEGRRVKRVNTAAARRLHGNLTLHIAFIKWADAATSAAAAMHAKVAQAMEFAFGNSVAFVLAKWHAVVKESKGKKTAMQRLVRLLSGFQTGNLGGAVLCDLASTPGVRS